MEYKELEYTQEQIAILRRMATEREEIFVRSYPTWASGYTWGRETPKNRTPIDTAAFWPLVQAKLVQATSWAGSHVSYGITNKGFLVLKSIVALNKQEEQTP